MHNRSTLTAPRNTRTQRALSPINAAQRAGYNLDAVPAGPSVQAVARSDTRPTQPSAARQPH